MKNLFTLLFLVALGISSMQAANITSSGVTTDWNTGSTWVGGVVPTSADDVTIDAAHTVTIGTAAGAAVTAASIACRDLIINGAVTINTPSSGNNDLYVYRTLTVTGTLIGSATGRLRPTGTTGATVTINGNFTTAARLNINVPNVIIDGTTTFGSFILSTQGYTMTINANKSLTTTANTGNQIGGGAANCTLTVDGTLTINAGSTTNYGTVNGTGTLNVSPGTGASATLTSLLSSGSGAPLLGGVYSVPTVNLIANGPSGQVNLAGTGTYNITTCTLSNAASGSSINFGSANSPTFNITTLTHSASAAVNFASAVVSTYNITTFNTTSTGSGNVSFGASGVYGTISNMTMNSDIGTRQININKNLSVNTLTMTLGRLRLNTTGVILTVTGSITGGSSNSYIQTDGILSVTGTKVRCTNITTSGTTVPLGGSVYAPITITPTATADITMAVGGTIAATNCLAAFAPAAVDNEKTVKVQYTLTNNGAGSVTTNLVLAPSTSANGSSYVATSPKAVARSASPWVQLTNSSVSGSTGTVTGEVIPAATTYNYAVSADGGVMTGIVLAAEVTQFQVKRNQTAALLTWTTASEKDNASFNIEQSTNGADFQTVGQVKGRGTTSVATDYNFEHNTPSVGINYYRLKQVDLNGKASYSAVRSLVFGKNGLVVKTTLVKDALDIVVSDETATPLSIFNAAGQQVLNVKTQGAQRFDVSTLPSGLYLIRTATGDVGRFVKQ